jgi:hypothetical protein
MFLFFKMDKVELSNCLKSKKWNADLADSGEFPQISLKSYPRQSA